MGVFMRASSPPDPNAAPADEISMILNLGFSGRSQKVPMNAVAETLPSLRYHEGLSHMSKIRCMVTLACLSGIA